MKALLSGRRIFPNQPSLNICLGCLPFEKFTLPRVIRWHLAEGSEDIGSWQVNLSWSSAMGQGGTSKMVLQEFRGPRAKRKSKYPLSRREIPNRKQGRSQRAHIGFSERIDTIQKHLARLIRKEQK